MLAFIGALLAAIAAILSFFGLRHGLATSMGWAALALLCLHAAVTAPWTPWRRPPG